MSRSSGGVSFAEKFDGKIEAVIAIVRIGLAAFLEIAARMLVATTRGDYAKVVVNLGEWQPGGKKVEGSFGLVIVAGKIGGHAEIKPGFVCIAVGVGNSGKPVDGLLILAAVVVRLGQLQHGEGVIGFQA